MNVSTGAPENNRPSSGVSRRTLVKTAAWTVPVIAFAAPVPAMAASPCTPSTNFDGLEVGSRPSSIIFYNSQAQPTGVSATLAWSSFGQGGNDQTPGDTGLVEQTDQGWNYLEAEMLQQLTAGDWVQLDLTIIGGPVTGLSFIVHDIDKEQGQWTDNIVVSPAGYTFQLGGNIQGNGTAGSPFNPIAFGDTPISSGLGDVRVTYPGSVSSLSIRYLAGATGNSSNQHVGIGDFSYNVCLPPGRGGQSRMAAGRFPVDVSTGEPAFVASSGSDQ
jgi:hypothetical protein